MDELKEKKVYIVFKATHLGLSTNGLTIIPAVVHQQHGDNVHCFIKGEDGKIIITVSENDIYLNIKDAMSQINTNLLEPTNNELDK